MDNTLPVKREAYTPIVFRADTEDGLGAFSEFCREWGRTYPPLDIIDDYPESQKESLLVTNPTSLTTGVPPIDTTVTEHTGIWVVYPWRKVAVHTVSENKFHELRLSRNHHLSTEEEQAILRKHTIGIAGLNVGNPAAICLVEEGIGNSFIFADNDTLSLSNLNRFRAGLPDLGLNKAVLSARQAYEIDPFIQIDVWADGITLPRLEEFVTASDVIVEEMDNLPLKIAIREEAKKQKKPVVMVTGNGHNIILDIERFDITPELPILNGKLSQAVIGKTASGPQSFTEKVALARDFMGSEYLEDRLLQSFDEIGKTIVGIPQLARASFLRGAVLTHAVRGIFLNEDVQSGRYAFGLSDLYAKRT